MIATRRCVTGASVLAALMILAACDRVPSPGTDASAPSAGSPAAVDSSLGAPPTRRKSTSRALTLYDAPYDDSTRLRIEQNANRGVGCCATEISVMLIDRADSTRRWVLDTVADHVTFIYDSPRVRGASVVMCRVEDSHGYSGGCAKHFIDAVARHGTARLTFELGRALAFESDADAARVLGVSTADVAHLRARGLLGGALDTVARPAAFTTHPMPRSTYAEFARARPARVKQGYVEERTTIEESVGPWLADSGGFWFGKSFYDGEGTSGVGAIGFLDSAGTYSFLEIPQLAMWSVGALWVESDVIWASLVDEAEFGPSSGGLLRYERSSKRATIIPIDRVIGRIATAGGAVFLWTTHGSHVVRGETILWHGMEPTVDGGWIVVTDTLRR